MASQSSYFPLPRYDSDKDSDVDPSAEPEKPRRFRRFWREIVIALLLAANLLLLVLYLRSAESGAKPWSSSYSNTTSHTVGMEADIFKPASTPTLRNGSDINGGPSTAPPMEIRQQL